VNDRFVVTTPILGSEMLVTGPLNEWGGSDGSAPSWRIEPADAADVVEVVAVDLVNVPDQYALHQNYPNPFNPSTTLNYDLPSDSEVRIVVFDVTGRMVIELLNAEYQAGSYQVIWNGRNMQGAAMPTGIYFAQMLTSDYTKTVKMLLVK